MFKILFSVFFLSTSTLGAVLVTNNEIASPQPQLQLKVMTITTKAGEIVMHAEVATTPFEQQVGMAGRRGIDIGEAMFFPNAKAEIETVYIRDTPSLDVLFIGEDHSVVSITRQTEAFRNSAITSLVPVSGILQMKGGYAENMGIEHGDMLRSEAFMNPPDTIVDKPATSALSDHMNGDDPDEARIN